MSVIDFYKNKYDYGKQYAMAHPDYVDESASNTIVDSKQESKTTLPVIDSLGLWNNLPNYNKSFTAPNPAFTANADTNNKNTSDQTNKDKYTDNISKAAIGVNAFNAIASGVLGMISLKSIRDSKPYLMPHTPDLEAKRISDTGAQQYVAGKDSITRAIRAARRESVASGTTYTDPAMVGKEMQASNELAARIEATRNNIEATNVQMENNIAAQNRQVRTSVDAQNANIINSFEQMKTNATSSVIGNMSTNISNNVSGIAQVIMQKNMRMEQERLSLLESIKDMKQKVLDYSASNNPGAQATASSYVDRMVEQYKKRYDSEPSLLF